MASGCPPNAWRTSGASKVLCVGAILVFLLLLHHSYTQSESDTFLAGKFAIAEADILVQLSESWQVACICR